MGLLGSFFWVSSSPHPLFRTLDAAALTWKQPKAPASDPGTGSCSSKEESQRECVWVSRLLSRRDREAHQGTGQPSSPASPESPESPAQPFFLFSSAPLPFHPKPSNLQSCRAILNLQRAIRLHRLDPLLSPLLSFFNLGSSIEHRTFIHPSIHPARHRTRPALRCDGPPTNSNYCQLIVWSESLTRSVQTQRSPSNFSFSPAAS